MIGGRSTDVHILFSDTEAMRQHGLSMSGLGSAAFSFRAELDEFGFGLVDILATQAKARDLQVLYRREIMVSQSDESLGSKHLGGTIKDHTVQPGSDGGRWGV